VAVAATTAREARLAVAELAAARAEVEAAEAADAARAAAAELEAQRGSSIGSSVSSDGGTNDEIRLAREATQEQAAQWAAARSGSLHRRRRADGAPGENERGGSPDGRGRADGAPGGGGRVDGDRGLYRRRGSPSSDRYHGHRGVQAVVRDISPDGGWPTLTKTKTISSNVLYMHPLYPSFTVSSKRFHLLYLLSLQQRPLNHVLYM
jgi:multidrug efflux pump subunit AcrA (membrane-fusion protein)